MKDFRKRCEISEACLPDAPYKESLIKLHREMLNKINELGFYKLNHTCLGCRGNRYHCGCGEYINKDL